MNAEILKDKDIERLLTYTSNPTEHAVIRLMLEGLRFNDIQAITPSDHLPQNKLQIPSKRPRVITISQHTSNALYRCNYHLKIHPRTFRDRLTKLGELCGLSHPLTQTTLRMTYAHNAVKTGQPPQELQRHLGLHRLDKAQSLRKKLCSAI